MIKVEEVSKSYDNFKALKDVTFEIPTDQITGFLGPNGAGKTTTMKILTGAMNPDSGEVRYAGEPFVLGKTRVVSGIGYLPENNPLYENMRVDEFLVFSAKFKGRYDKKELRKISEECGLEDVLSKSIDTLSKGYRQRVGLAKALIGNPEYLILDEPTTGLDPNQKDQILDLIKSIAKNRTILLSSHIISEINRIADKIVIINKGKIVAQGKADELIIKHLKSSVVYVETNAKEAEFVKALKQFQTILDVRILQNLQNGIARYEVRSGKIDEAAAKIFEVVVKNNWKLLELHKQTHGLENLFKELTQ